MRAIAVSVAVLMIMAATPAFAQGASADESAGAATAKAVALHGQDAVKKVDVTAERFAFTPSEITVERGTTIEFHLTSEDTDHGFRIIGADVDVQIPKRRRGETVVRYLADTAGRFVIECSRPCGAGHTAMRAVLVVKEPESRGAGNQ